MLCRCLVRSVLSEEPIKLSDASAIKVPDVPWSSSSSGSRGESKKLKDVLVSSLEPTADASVGHLAKNTEKKEVKIFDPSASDGLTAFYNIESEQANQAMNKDSINIPADVHIDSAISLPSSSNSSDVFNSK